VKRYAAVFKFGEFETVVVSPFDTPSKAAEYGDAFKSDLATFTGETPEVLNPTWFERLVVSRQMRADLNADRTEEGHWIGEVTRSEETFGFITCSSRGGSWFFSKTDDHGHDSDVFEVGTRVSFTGSPHPTFGKRYPQAFTIRALNEGDQD